MSARLADLAPRGVAFPPEAADLVIEGLALDSRKVKPGDLFAALPGVKTDGRRFIEAAEAAGAVAILAPPGTTTSRPLVAAEDPSAALAVMAARFHPRQPAHIHAVTGTNGKSSSVEFLRQIWAAAGYQAAALGTLGVTRASGRVDVGFTTPDAIALHRSLDQLAAEGVTHLAMEASSHGLKQRRMDGARLAVSGFTNLTQDHLDYHPTFEDYFDSKARLFTELTPAGAPAVVNVDSDWGEAMAERARAARLDVVTLGWRGRDLKIEEITPRAASQHLRFIWRGEARDADLPLIGEFQAANALGAAVMAIVGGAPEARVWAALEGLTGVPGRLETAVVTRQGCPVLVDYAHTPDGLDKLLRAARPHTKGRVMVVFGAGGDRDPSKRKPMGETAARLADMVYVTDDNPRSEDAAAIRRAILTGAPDAIEIADRAEAIAAAVAELREGDALLLAGKGHETGQIVGDRVIPFDDREAARAAVERQEARNR